jgi:hypothetical protein
LSVNVNGVGVIATHFRSTYTYIHTYACTYTYTNTYTNTNTYAHTYTYTHIHIYIHIHKVTYMRAEWSTTQHNTRFIVGGTEQHSTAQRDDVPCVA